MVIAGDLVSRVRMEFDGTGVLIYLRMVFWDGILVDEDFVGRNDYKIYFSYSLDYEEYENCSKLTKDLQCAIYILLIMVLP